MAAEVGCGHTARHGAFLAAGTRRPVHDDEMHRLTIEQAAHHKLVAGDKFRVVGHNGAV